MGANEQGADATAGRWLTIPRTLCFVTYGDELLLMKRGPHRRVFPNRYNGVGGHIERDEDPYTGAIREIKEETGLDVRDVRLRGIHNIDAGGDSGIMIFVFTAEALSQQVVDAGDEGALHWVRRDDLMTLDLVEDLPFVLPRLWDETPYFAHVSYNDRDEIQIRFV